MDTVNVLGMPLVTTVKHRLFAYGTLNEPVTQQWVWQRKPKGKPYTLEGYKRLGGYIPWIVPDTDSEVEGMIYELNDAELARTDAYEGEMYRRVKVVFGDGTWAWAYADAINRKEKSYD